MSIMGTRVVRTEDPLFLSRGATYTDDLTDERLTGALHLTLVRSPLAHGRITGIDVEAAKATPGVVGVFTAADLDLAPALLFPAANRAMVRPFLASDRVRFVGEPVAAVLTEHPYQGQDAAELVEVDYDPLPAVIGLKDALADDVVLSRRGRHQPRPGFDEQFDEHLFDDCEVVVTREIVNQRLAAAPLETRAAAAVWGDDGRVTLFAPRRTRRWRATRSPDGSGIEPALVHVILPDVGGGFGAKIGADPTFALVAWLAKQVGRPVRWTESRSENMTGMLQGRAQLQTVTIGGRRDGTCSPTASTCSPTPAPTRGSARSSRSSRGRWHRASTTSRRSSPGRARSSPPPRPPGPTAAQAAPRPPLRSSGPWTCSRPRSAWTRPRCAGSTSCRPTSSRSPRRAGPPTTRGEYAKAIDRVLDAAGYAELRAEQAARRERGDTVQLGIGVSAYVEITGGGAFSEDAAVEVHADGTVTVLTGTSPHGQGHATAWAMLASEHLGIPIEKITVKHGDTDLIPRGVGTMGSRSLQTGGVAVYQAAGELVELAKQRAADLLEASVEDLEVAEGRVSVQGTGTGVDLAELAEKEQLRVDTTFDSGRLDVPVRRARRGRRGRRRVGQGGGRPDRHGRRRRARCSTRCSRRASATAASLRASRRRCSRRSSTTTTATRSRPRSPTTRSRPRPSCPASPSSTWPRPRPLNPIGAKGIGEAGTIGATPAVQSAVVDAVSHLGVRHIDMPTTPLRVWEAIQAAGGAK